MASRAENLFDNLVKPEIQRSQWYSAEVDELVSLLVKLRSSLYVKERLHQGQQSRIGDQLIEAGLVTGWFRENPLLSSHGKVESIPTEKSGPEDLRKYRKDLINSAMGSYCGSHAKKGHRKMNKYVQQEMGADGQMHVQDPVAGFDEEHLYHQRAKTIQAMLESTKDFNEIAAELGADKTSPALMLRGPDGIHPTFLRHNQRTASPISNTPVKFY